MHEAFLPDDGLREGRKADLVSHLEKTLERDPSVDLKSRNWLDSFQPWPSGDRKTKQKTLQPSL